MGGKNFEGTFPFIPGHEWIGEVIEVGKEVQTLKIGDRVTGECVISCGVCPIYHNGGPPAFCKNNRYFGFTWDTAGGMAELHVSPEQRLHKIPDTISDGEASLVDPGSVAYHSIWGRRGGVASHETVAVFGTGPIGLFAVQIVKIAGATVIAVEFVTTALSCAGRDETHHKGATGTAKRSDRGGQSLRCAREGLHRTLPSRICAVRTLTSTG